MKDITEEKNSSFTKANLKSYGQQEDGATNGGNTAANWPAPHLPDQPGGGMHPLSWGGSADACSDILNWESGNEI